MLAKTLAFHHGVQGGQAAHFFGAAMLVMLNTPMVLYHATPKDRLAKFGRQGLKPHVPGRGKSDPAVTRHRPVVWLTADPTTWRHAKHPDKALRHPDFVLLAILERAKASPLFVVD